MKRNHTNNRVGRTGRSPWQRHGKRPFHYSEVLQRLLGAAKAGRWSEYAALKEQHSAMTF